MSIRAGVWIDHRRAILVLIKPVGREIKKIDSGIERPNRSRSSNANTPNDHVAEDRLERKFDSRLRDFFDEVIADIQGAQAILILGPGEAKGEFLKRLRGEKFRGLVVGPETADKMTDRQLAARVAQHFAAIPAKDSVAPKNTAKSNTLKSTSAKPK